ncbi:D-3-phosphoglycerate dehydrogenase [Cohaesibacter marisflavi]|uniref:D-3-phosphoglycerate dehydrogenase n=1 Tax=Cohaesibacter marisflavi TaxID=655353 RepID=A0A1I4ZEI7_9HYPH|nr:hydroxyacid dehydrogenase [Cohaesibacter marisflavi]SFN48695.1 D-3-phosphoglycerate dehydrogenase [Cohaesibacter marisflavi]
MKCLIIQPIHEIGHAMLRDAGIEPVMCPSPDMETVIKMIPGCDAVITRDAGFSAEAAVASDKLKVIIVHGAGHDAVNKEAASEKGILVCNTPGQNSRSVSELAVGLILSCLRHIPEANRAERAGEKGIRERETYTELTGKTALIVGWGTIGRGLGHMLKAAFDMTILVYSPRAPQVDGFERVTSLEEGLAKADVISLHTPMRPETANMICKASLAKTKPGAVLINTARAGLVNESDLAEAILSGQISAAALDVYSHDAPTGPLAETGHVIFTPHLGGTTTEAMKRMAIGSVGHLLKALSGERPETAVNEPKL